MLCVLLLRYFKDLALNVLIIRYFSIILVQDKNFYCTHLPNFKSNHLFTYSVFAKSYKKKKNKCKIVKINKINVLTIECIGHFNICIIYYIAKMFKR